MFESKEFFVCQVRLTGGVGTERVGRSGVGWGGISWVCTVVGEQMRTRSICCCIIMGAVWY